MMHKAWSNTEEVPYSFSRSSVKLQGHTGQKITEFDPNWAFPDCNLSLNSPMATEWCINLAWSNIEEVPIVFQGHLSSFKVTQDNKSPILTLIQCFRTVSLVLIHRWLWNDAKSLMYHRRGALLFWSSIKFQDNAGQKISDFDPNWAFPDSYSSFNYTNPGYGFSLVDTLWNAGSYRQPLEQEGNPMT